MTSIDTWSPWAAILFLGAPGLLSAVGLAYSLYLSHRHIEEIKEALKNSRYIYLWGPSLGKRGLIWSLLEIAKIAGMMTWPKAYIRIGDLNPVDFENFPTHLKRRLFANMAIAFVALPWAIVAAVLVEFR
ncbi:hypothetical protein PspS35_07520 [Pseudomonas sp. S35]|uniref:hypothetical protein n=1 Tax=Pseudomonas sp. S35 TaxID=1573719 RepID=UPI00132E95B2|nr:hypothetical protein [Pseudomonas sp. S35]QHF43661.1 hypothetical protein PspS35_07520 [Pseudomonas sp. S35]